MRSYWLLAFVVCLVVTRNIAVKQMKLAEHCIRHPELSQIVITHPLATNRGCSSVVPFSHFHLPLLAFLIMNVKKTPMHTRIASLCGMFRGRG